MSTYRVATGHGVSLGSLTVLSPQPRSAGLQYVRRTVMPNGSLVAEGAYVELLWNTIRNASMYQTLLTAFGLHSAMSANVTVYIRDDLFVWTRYNGRAIRPVASWDNYFPRNVVIVVRNLAVSG